MMHCRAKGSRGTEGTDYAGGMRALILDFGEVLVRPQPAAIVSEMAALAQLDPGEFRQRYWTHRPAYDAGLDADEYWHRVIDGTHLDAAAMAKAIAALKEADARSWTDYREALWHLTADFKRSGGRTAFLSNGVPEVMSHVREERALEEYFDAVIVSYEVGFTKPDPRIYELCLARLGVPAAATLFADDRPENLEPARRIGIETLLFRGDDNVEDIRKWITQP